MASKTTVQLYDQAISGILHFLHAQCSAATDQQREVFTGCRNVSCPASKAPASYPRFHLALKIPHLASILTNVSQALHGDGKALGAWQQMVLEAGQPLGLCHLHADLVFLLREPCALTVDQELKSKGRRSYRRIPQLHHPKLNQGSQSQRGS